MGQCLDKDKKNLVGDGQEMKTGKKKNRWNGKFKRMRKQKAKSNVFTSSNSPAFNGLNASPDLKSSDLKSKTNLNKEVPLDSSQAASNIVDQENNPNLGKAPKRNSVDLNINININYYEQSKKENIKKSLYHTQLLDKTSVKPPLNIIQTSVSSSVDSNHTTIIQDSNEDSTLLKSPKARVVVSPGRRGFNMFNSPKMSGPRVLFKSPLQKQFALKREKNNSTSTLFIKDTLNSPNVDEILRCMSTALLYHIRNGVQAEKNLLIPLFSEKYYPLTKEKLDFENVPDVGSIYKFIKMIFRVQKLPPECAILCLAYIERILAGHRIVLHPENWRRIIFGSIIIATKVWEDESVWNVDFLDVFPMLTLNDLNNTENKFLELLQFNVLITGSEYAKYYFELRALSQGNVFPLEPLNKETQAKIEARSNSYKSFVPPGIQKEKKCCCNSSKFRCDCWILKREEMQKC